ncbi:hypothetical protein LXL04_040114 [Taraxacum kok-saghyz]
MIPSSCVHATAIDIWAMQLSYTEQFRSRTSQARLFMPSTILSNMVFDKRYTKDEWFKFFETIMNQHLEKYREFGDIRESHLVSILPECVVIDNSGVDVPMDAKYGTVPIDMTYKGEKMEKWDASLEMECDSLQEQLNKLRWKYVTKMLLSDMNLLKDYVEGKMDSYVNIPEHIRKKFEKKAHLEKIEL